MTESGSTLVTVDDRRWSLPPAEVICWASFLAGRPLAVADLELVAKALAAEGPLAALTIAEARRVLRGLAALDAIGRAHTWMAIRTSIHTVEARMRHTPLTVGVLHRYDPVLVAPEGLGHPVVTERSLRSWCALRALVVDLAGQSPSRDSGYFDEMRMLLVERRRSPGALRSRRRIGHGPVALAAIRSMLDQADASLRIAIEAGLSGLDPSDAAAVDAQAERLWAGAEIKRFARTVAGSTTVNRSPSSGRTAGDAD